MAKHLLNKDTYKDFDTSQFASFASQIVDTRVILGNGKLSKELVVCSVVLVINFFLILK